MFSFSCSRLFGDWLESSWVWRVYSESPWVHASCGRGRNGEKVFSLACTVHLSHHTSACTVGTTLFGVQDVLVYNYCAHMKWSVSYLPIVSAGSSVPIPRGQCCWCGCKVCCDKAWISTGWHHYVRMVHWWVFHIEPSKARNPIPPHTLNPARLVIPSLHTHWTQQGS